MNILMVLALLFPISVFAQDSENGLEVTDSIINLPISANLNLIEKHLNDRAPETLHNIDEDGHVCVEAEYMRTKGLPSCSLRGIEISCTDTWISTKITPEIKCDLNGWVKRNGNISLEGQGSQISVAIPIRFSITAQGRGALGSAITQTADGGAVIFATLEPRVTENWDIQAATSTDFRWAPKPKIKLFNLIDVSIAGESEGAVRDALNDLESEIPTLIQEIGFKSKVEAAWRDIQRPIAVDEANGIFLSIRPNAIGFSNIDVSHNILKASFSLSGKPSIHFTDDFDEVDEIIPLPNLNQTSMGNTGVSILVPVHLGIDELEGRSNDIIEDLEPFDLSEHGIDSNVKLSNLELWVDQGKLNLSLYAKLDRNESFWDWIDIFGLRDVKGKVFFETKLVVDSDKRELRLSELDFDLDSNNLLADSIIEVARLKPFRELIMQKLYYDFGNDLEKARLLVGKEINRDLENEVAINGRITTLTIEQPRIGSENVSIPVILAGELSLSAGL